jgi:hypothetical protein
VVSRGEECSAWIVLSCVASEFGVLSLIFDVSVLGSRVERDAVRSGRGAVSRMVRKQGICWEFRRCSECDPA